MRRSLPFLAAFTLLAVLWLCGSAGVAASAATPADPTRTEVVKVDGPIDRVEFAYLDDSLDRAVQDGAVVVLQLDTPGTLGQDGLALADRVAAMPVPVLTWVGPVPAKASGAGLLLMLASSLAAVAPGSQTGPLQPVDVLDPEGDPADLVAQAEALAAGRGRTIDTSALGRALPGDPAIAAGFAQLGATSVPDLLDQVDGMQVPVAGGQVELQTKIATDEQQLAQGSVDIRFEDLGPIERVLHAVATPSMAFFLIVFGLACVAFEITQPGFGFAGFAGLAVLVLGTYAVWVVPPSWLGFAMLLAGIGMLVWDVRLRRLGPLTFGGLAVFGLGSWLAWHDVAEAVRISPWMLGGVLVATLLYYGFGLTVALQSRDRILSTQRAMIGLVGEARGRMAPDGPVFVKGALWRGRSVGEEIASGTRVRIRGVEGLLLKVEADPQATLTTENDLAPVPD